MARKGNGPQAPGTAVGSGMPVRLDRPFLATARVLAAADFDALFTELRARGYQVAAPSVVDGVVRLVPTTGAATLPVGHHDRQAPGAYRIEDGGDGEYFGYAVGPDSLKSVVFPPVATLWRARPGDGALEAHSGTPVPPPLAVIGARPCDVAALDVLMNVLGAGTDPDPTAVARREGLFVVAVECTRPASTCFCTSFGTGPSIDHGADVMLSELDPPGVAGSAGEHRFVLRPGTARGAAVLRSLPTRPAGADDLAAREARLAHARRTITRRIDPDACAESLEASIEHPAWGEVADRCLACGNCTLSCPTCFCSDIHDASDLDGTVRRERRWASCFELSHSLLSGGPVRRSVGARYRQWATHKLATWQEQFGTAGCVGCGRCLTWCPVGIDLTAEAGALVAADAARAGR